MANYLKKYLELWGYDVKDSTGKQCLFLNISDFILLCLYLFLVITALWTYGIRSLSYISIIMVALRSLVRFWQEHQLVKRDGKSITAVYTVSFTVYLMLSFILILIYFYIYFSPKGLNEGTSLSKVLLTFYYLIFALFETNGILAKCFNATPHLYNG